MIPVNEPLLTEADFASVNQALRSGWISGAGPHIDAFEAGWAAYCGRKHGIAVANGTVALQVAVSLLDLQPGDEVIMPTFTIISCALPVVLAGARPVLVDSDPRSWTMDTAQVGSKITSRTRAIMAVHIYGHPVDMDPLIELATQHRLDLIEDAAEAHGAEYRGRRIGGFGASSCFSFYANKLVTTGEGGMVLVDDDHLAERARRLRNLGFQSARRFLHAELGFNFRLT
ncbi:MAG TPA: DegT/DnrJ/EryC1/StrS family aminotransferase, partial [Chloroflexota bacterium]